MIRRLFWLGVGVGIGAVVVRVVTRKAQAYTPTGLARSTQESVGQLAGSLRNFVDEVRDGMADREYEIRTAFAEGTALDEKTVPWAEDVGGRFGLFTIEQQLKQEGEQQQ